MQKHKELYIVLAVLILSIAALGVVRADFTGPSAAPPTGDGVIVTDGSGNVGIGASPSHKLHISGSAAGDTKLIVSDSGAANAAIEIRDTSSSASLYIDFTPGSTSDSGSGTPDFGGRIIYNSGSFNFSTNGNGTARMTIDSSGNVGIGDTTPSYKLDVSGDIRSTGVIYADANGAAYLNGGDDATLNDVNVANTVGIYGQQDSTVGCIRLGSGASDLCGSSTNFTMTGTLTVSKVNANTIDPIYTIDGERYATYVASMIGIKEEVTGLIHVDGEVTIDFRNQEKGSDLWLFAKATDLERNFAEMVVLLTPSFDGRVWYEKDPETLQLTIHTDGSGEVSYRMTAPRYDWKVWPNVLGVDGPSGHIINTGPGGVMVSGQ